MKTSCKLVDVPYSMQKDLVTNLNHLVTRSKKGIPSTIIVYGAQRSGKSTLARQMAYYCAKALGVPFTVDEIFFSVDKLLESCIGKQRGVFVLDEAAFDLLSYDWQKNSAKKLHKYLLTAAKYGQIVFILAPRLENMSRNVIDDHHTKGVDVEYNLKSDKRYFYTLNNTLLRTKYNLLKKQAYFSANKMRGTLLGTFPSASDFIDMEQYDKMKDAAIHEMTKDEEKEEKQSKKEIKLKTLQKSISRIPKEMRGVTQKALARHFGVTEQTMDNWSNLTI
jgi:DNA-binding transcriptional regulator YiaG